MLLVTDLMDVKWCKNPCSGESSFDVNRVNSNIGEKMGHAVREVIKCNMLRRFSHLVMKLPEDSKCVLKRDAWHWCGKAVSCMVGQNLFG